jgi:hypothetical protein
LRENRKEGPTPVVGKSPNGKSRLIENAHSDREQESKEKYQLNSRDRIVVRYVISFTICMMGSLLAYHGPLSSDAWRFWDGGLAWIKDTIRAFVCALAGLFMLANMNAAVRPNPKADADPKLTSLRLRPAERIVLWLFICFLVYATVFPLREDFERTLIMPPRNYTGPLNFGNIWMPYFPYFFYILGLWIGIGFPVLIFLGRNVRLDRDWWLRARSDLDKVCFREFKVENNPQEDATQDIGVAFQDFAIGLRSIGERYLPVSLSVCLLLLYEQLTPSNKTVTGTAGDWGKLTLWLLLGPSLVVCFFLVALGYQRAARKVEIGFRSLAEAAKSTPDGKDSFVKATKARTDLLWNRSPAAFVLLIIKSASISVLLLVTVTVYVLKTITSPEGWFGVFLPKIVMETFKKIYVGH